MTKQTIKAFPVGDIKQYGQRGMDLRDYIATAALQGNLAHYGLGQALDLERVAKNAYDLADAMLKERERDNDK